MTATINFSIRTYEDFPSVATPVEGGEPKHEGFMHHVEFQPSSLITNGYQEDLLRFVGHFRYWRWYGTRVVCVPAARAPVDPAHVVSSGSTSGGLIESWDLMRFHAYKLWDFRPQTVKISSESDIPGGNGDDMFLMDRSWRKCSIWKPWSLFVKPMAYELNHNVPVFGEYPIEYMSDVAEKPFDPSRLTAVPVTPDVRSSTEVGGPVSLDTDITTPVGDIYDPERIGRSAQSNGQTGWHAHYIASNEEAEIVPEHITTGYDYPIIENHTHTIGAADLAAAVTTKHVHPFDVDDVASKIKFNYQDAPPGPNRKIRPDGVMYTGRIKYAGGWWPTRGWTMGYNPANASTVKILNDISYPGYLWRQPKHWKTQSVWRVWYTHYFGLKSPITHIIYNSYDAVNHSFVESYREPKKDAPRAIFDFNQGEYVEDYADLEPTDEHEIHFTGSTN